MFCEKLLGRQPVHAGFKQLLHGGVNLHMHGLPCHPDYAQLAHGVRHLHGLSLHLLQGAHKQYNGFKPQHLPISHPQSSIHRLHLWQNLQMQLPSTCLQRVQRSQLHSPSLFKQRVHLSQTQGVCWHEWHGLQLQFA